MSFRLKAEITNLKDRQISNEIKVEKGVLYVKKDGYSYKYDHGWFIYTNVWVNLQGGIPSLEFDNNVDEDILEEIGE